MKITNYFDCLFTSKIQDIEALCISHILPAIVICGIGMAAAIMAFAMESFTCCNKNKKEQTNSNIQSPAWMSGHH
jgi:hypothetical protein